MREEARTRNEYYSVYIAEDGREFKSKEECRKYEESAKFAITAACMSLNRTKILAEDFPYVGIGYESEIHAFRITDENDLKVLNQMLNLKQTTALPAKYIGKVVLIEELVYESEWYLIGESEEMKERFCKAIDELVKTIDATETENSND